MNKLFLNIALSCVLLSCMTPRNEEERRYAFGPVPTVDSALLFMPGIVSTDSVEHSSPTFSVDGKVMLWSIMEMPAYKTTIRQIVYVNGSWTEAHTPAFSDTTVSEVSPSFSPDGNQLYFSSARQLPSGKFPPRGNLLWTVNLHSGGWGDPQPIDTAITRGGDYSPSVSSGGSIYFTHGPFRSPDWNIYRGYLRNAKASDSSVVVPVINSSSYEDGPFIAPDESYLIFESDRTGGSGNSIDLYISFKSPDGAWSLPVNLGPKVNTAASERFARVSPDGKYLFFGSDRRIVNGKPNLDIYWIDAGVIEEVRSALR